MTRLTHRPAMTKSVDLGRKATKQTNKQNNKLIPAVFTMLICLLEDYSKFNQNICIDVQCPSRLQQTTNFAKLGMIFHENCLPADNSHEISCLISYFLKSCKV